MSVAFSPDGKTLASGGVYSRIKIWNLENGAQIKNLHDYCYSVNSVAFSPDGKTLASGASGTLDGAVKLWNLENGAQIKGCIKSGYSLYLGAE